MSNKESVKYAKMLVDFGGTKSESEYAKMLEPYENEKIHFALKYRMLLDEILK